LKKLNGQVVLVFDTGINFASLDLNRKEECKQKDQEQSSLGRCDYYQNPSPENCIEKTVWTKT